MNVTAEHWLASIGRALIQRSTKIGTRVPFSIAVDTHHFGPDEIPAMYRFPGFSNPSFDAG